MFRRYFRYIIITFVLCIVVIYSSLVIRGKIEGYNKKESTSDCYYLFKEQHCKSIQVLESFSNRYKISYTAYNYLSDKKIVVIKKPNHYPDLNVDSLLVNNRENPSMFGYSDVLYPPSSNISVDIQYKLPYLKQVVLSIPESAGLHIVKNELDFIHVKSDGNWIGVGKNKHVNIVFTSRLPVENTSLELVLIKKKGNLYYIFMAYEENELDFKKGEILTNLIQ